MGRLPDLARGDRVTVRWCDRLYADACVLEVFRNGRVKVHLRDKAFHIDAVAIVERGGILVRTGRAAAN